MSGKRQNNQLQLAFTAGGRGEAPEATPEGTEPQPVTRTTESPADTKQLSWLLGRMLNRIEPPCTDPYARWCGRGRAARPSPIPMCAEHVRQLGGESPLHNLVEVKC